MRVAIEGKDMGVIDENVKASERVAWVERMTADFPKYEKLWEIALYMGSSHENSWREHCLACIHSKGNRGYYGQLLKNLVFIDRQSKRKYRTWCKKRISYATIRCEHFELEKTGKEAKSLHKSAFGKRYKI